MGFSSSGTRAELLVLAIRRTKAQSLAAPCVEVPLGAGERSDESLVTLIAVGNEEALECLFRRYAPLVRSIGRRILRDAAEAEDLVQEVFLYFYRKSALYDSSKGAARSWIFQITYTQAFLRRRQLKARGFYASDTANRLREAAPPDVSGPDYDNSVEGRFGRNGWRKLLGALTDNERETLRLHFFEGYTFAEIAEKLGQSYANIRNHYYRGLGRLRKSVGPGAQR